jgi:hypothetical protein
MPILISSYAPHHIKGESLSRRRVHSTQSKRVSQRRVVRQHKLALTQRQEVRREVPLADERTLNLVFND